MSYSITDIFRSILIDLGLIHRLFHKNEPHLVYILIRSVLFYRVFPKKGPTLVFGTFQLQNPYGMNILILTIQMTGKWNWLWSRLSQLTERWIQANGNPFRYRLNFYNFLYSVWTWLMFRPISIWCHSFTHVHVMKEIIKNRIHVALMYDSTALRAILFSEMLTI